jgi:hypothetical protein
VDDFDGTYRPSWKVRLTIRLEEFDSGALKPRVPGKLTKNLNGMKDDGTSLEVVPDPDNPRRFIFRDRAPAPVQLAWGIGGGFFPSASSDGLTHAVSGIIPKSFDLKVNGIRAADELRVSIRGEDFPIDPRVCRSIGVEFFLGTLTALEYAQGQRGKTRAQAFGAGVPNGVEPLSVIPDTYVDDRGNKRTNLRFQGWVDKAKQKLSNKGAPMVEFECRDHTQLLLTQAAPMRLVIGAKDPLDKAIATYLSNFKQFAGLSVEYVGEPGQQAPVLEKVLAGTAYRPDLGPQPSGGGNGGGGDDLTVWDYLTDVCGSIGHVVFLDGTRILISRPATILGGNVSTRADDAYVARTTSAGTFPVRALVHGQNLEELEISRDMAGLEAKNIELRCWSPRKKQLLVSRYPGKDDRIASARPGDSADNKFTVIRIRGIENQALLDQMAEDYFNAGSRTEMEVAAKTQVLASFGGDNADPDLLDLKATDAVEILIDRAAASTTSIVERQLTKYAANSQRLRDLGYSPQFADAYAKAYTNAAFQRFFRVREVGYHGDVEEGVQVEIRAANFLQVRGEIGNRAQPANSNPSAKKAANSPEAKPVPKGTTPTVTSDAKPAGQVQIGTRDGKPIYAKTTGR